MRTAQFPHDMPHDESGLPHLASWQWSELLDELYAHATWLWEHDREELADTLAELADALARQQMIGADPDADTRYDEDWPNE